MLALLNACAPAHILTTVGDNGCVHWASLCDLSICLRVPAFGRLAETGDDKSALRGRGAVRWWNGRGQRSVFIAVAAVIVVACAAYGG